MSGFVKRTKAVDTVNPAGGIDPAKSPNVGQYGWTSFDAGNVNQIIEYVDMCKKYAEQASQSAGYIEGKIVELEAFMRYIEKVYEEIKPIYDDIIPMYNDIVARHDDIKVRYEDIVSMHGDVEGWHYETGILAEETEANALKALTSQLLAGQSEQGAEGWYNKSYELYEELQKGNVYRGTWNPHTLAYPDNGGTNSTWDVILNEGELEYVWNGIRWFWGDRLVYIKTSNTYQQIESGTTVNSVNGKKGAVVLTAADVQAVPITRTVNGKELSSNISITSSDTNSVPITRRINNKVLDADLDLTPEDVYSVPLGRTVNNKPLTADVTLNANDVGAFPLAGGTLNGPIIAKSYSIAESPNGQNWVGIECPDDGAPYISSKINNVAKKAIEFGTNGTTRLMSNVSVNGSVSSEAWGNAFSTIGGNIRSNTPDVMSLDGQAYSFVTSPADAHLCQNSYWDGSNWLKYNVDNPSGHLFVRDGALRFNSSDTGVDNPNQKADYVYHTGHRPTPAEIGAIPLVGGTMQGHGELHWSNSGASLQSRDNQFISLEGGTHAIVTTGRTNADGASYIGRNFYYEGGWKKFNNSKDSAFLEVTGSGMTFFQSDAGSDNPIQKHYKVYHEGFKPSAADVSAAPSGFGLGEGPFVNRGDANRIFNNGWQDYNVDGGDTNGAESYGVILHSGNKGNGDVYSGWSSQFFQGTSGKLHYRNNKTGGSFNGTSWEQIYTSANNPLNDAGTYDGQPRDFNTLEPGFSGLVIISGSSNTPPPSTWGDGHTYVEVKRVLGGEIVQRTLPFRNCETTASRVRQSDGVWTDWKVDLVVRYIGPGADLNNYFNSHNFGSYSVEGTNTANWPWNNASAGTLVVDGIGGYTRQQAWRVDTFDTLVRFREGAGPWSAWQSVYNSGYFPKISNWKNFGETAQNVVGGLAWGNFGNNHAIVDVSSGVAPDGTVVDRHNSKAPWTSTFPTLVGWNGSDGTYGVRVDSARVADTVTTVAATAVQVTDPRTKKEENLMDVILELKVEIAKLKSEVCLTKEKLNEFILK